MTNAQRRVVAVGFVLGVTAVGVAVQSHQGAPATQAQSAAPTSEVTLVGCLMPTDTGMRGPATTGASSPGARGELAKPTSGYVLKDASLVTKSTSGGEAKMSGAAALEYRLMPADRNVKLGDHERQQVEVRGQLINPEQATDPNKGLTPDRADTAHTVKVTAVRKLANACGPA